MVNMLRAYDVASVCSDLCSVRPREALQALRCLSIALTSLKCCLYDGFPHFAPDTSLERHECVYCCTRKWPSGRSSRLVIDETRVLIHPATAQSF